MRSRNSFRFILGLTAFWALLLVSPWAAAREPGTATFAIVVGVNRSADRGVTPLRYADDDAARYFDLFRALGAHSLLLATLDGNTRRLHAQAAAEARPPTLSNLSESAAQIARAVAQARRQGLRTELYFVYAGHGNVKNGRGYVSFGGAPLTGEQLRDQVVRRVAADRAHLIIDACHSYYLAHSRGAGGRRRAVRGFAALKSLFDPAYTGLLLSTSSARESHEWEAFQAGVFSHEVRSGLYGAADADRNGRVSYRELAAFVEQANAAIPNERYRPSIFARPPKGADVLVDLRKALARRLEVPKGDHGRYFLENEQGVRLADFHNGSGQAVRLLRPLSEGALYLRSSRDEREYLLPSQLDVVTLAALSPEAPRTAARGAAHRAFSLLFELPFDQRVVARYRPPSSDSGYGVESDVPPAQLDAPQPRTVIGLGVIGVGAVAAGLATYTWIDARRAEGDTRGKSQAQVAILNDEIETKNTRAAVLYGIAGAAVLGGTLILLWPEAKTDAVLLPEIGVSPTGGSASLGGRF